MDSEKFLSVERTSTTVGIVSRMLAFVLSLLFIVLLYDKKISIPPTPFGQRCVIASLLFGLLPGMVDFYQLKRDGIFWELQICDDPNSVLRLLQRLAMVFLVATKEVAALFMVRFLLVNAPTAWAWGIACSSFLIFLVVEWGVGNGLEKIVPYKRPRVWDEVY